jgi:hypothetical protein
VEEGVSLKFREIGSRSLSPISIASI